MVRTGIGRTGADPKVMVGTPAIVCGRLSKGCVIISSGHAEWSTGLESFLLRYIEWAAGAGDFHTGGLERGEHFIAESAGSAQIMGVEVFADTARREVR